MAQHFYNNPSIGFGVGARIPAESTTSGDSSIGVDDFQQKINSITDLISGMIEAPEDKDYTLIRNSPVEVTITGTTTMASAGTGSGVFKIDGVAIGGAAHSVSTAESVEAHASANVVSVGGNLILTMSGVAALENMDFTVKYTRGVS